MLFPLEFGRADDEGDELVGIDGLVGAVLRHDGLLQDFPGGIADTALEQRVDGVVEDGVGLVEVDAREEGLRTSRR
jgi:hypothetical protein